MDNGIRGSPDSTSVYLQQQQQQQLQPQANGISSGGSRFSRLRFTGKSKEKDPSNHSNSDLSLAMSPAAADTSSYSSHPSSSASSSHHHHPWSHGSPSSSISPSLYPASNASTSSPAYHPYQPPSINHNQFSSSPLSSVYHRPLPEIPPEEESNFEHPSDHPVLAPYLQQSQNSGIASPRLRWPTAFNLGGGGGNSSSSSSSHYDPAPNPTSSFDAEISLPPSNSSSSISSRYAKAAWGGGKASHRSSPIEELNQSSVGPAKSPSSQFASGMRAAGQSAGAGLRKLGNSAGKLRQRALSNSGKDGAVSRDGVVGLGLTNSSSSREAPPVPSLPSHYSSDSPLPFDADPHRTGSSHTRSSSRGAIEPVESVPDPRIGMPYAVQHNVHVDVGPYGFTGLPSSWAKFLTSDAQSQDNSDYAESKQGETGIRDDGDRESEEYVQGEDEREEEWNREVGIQKSTWDDDSSGSGATSIARDNSLGARTTTSKSTTRRKASRSRDEDLDRNKSFKSFKGRSYKSGYSESEFQDGRVSVASTSYSSVLNQGWPSPTWDNSHYPPSPMSSFPKSGFPSRPSSRPPSAGSSYAIPPLPNQASFKSLDFLSGDSEFKKVDASPLLPDLRSDDDWASSLLLSLPQDGSTTATPREVDEEKVKPASSISANAMASAKLVAERERSESEKKKDRRRSRSVDFTGIRKFGNALGGASPDQNDQPAFAKPMSRRKPSAASFETTGSAEQDAEEELVHIISSASVDRVTVHQGGKPRAMRASDLSFSSSRQRLQTGSPGSAGSGQGHGSSEGHAHGLGIGPVDRGSSPLNSSKHRGSRVSEASSTLQSPTSPVASSFSAASDSNYHSAGSSAANHQVGLPPSSSLKSVNNPASRSTPSLALSASTTSPFQPPSPPSPVTTFRQPSGSIQAAGISLEQGSTNLPPEKTSLPGIPGLGLRDKRKVPPKIYPPSATIQAGLPSARRDSSQSTSSDANPPLSPLEVKRVMDSSVSSSYRRGSSGQSSIDRLPSPSDQIDKRGSFTSSQNSHSSGYESLYSRNGARSPGGGLHPTLARRNSKSSQNSDYTAATNPGSASLSGSSRRGLNSRAATSPEARTSIGSNTSYSTSTRYNSPAPGNFGSSANLNYQSQKRNVPIISPGPNGFYQAPPVIRSSSRPVPSQTQDSNRISPASERSDPLSYQDTPTRQNSNDLALPSPSHSRFSDSTRLSSKTASSGGRGAPLVNDNEESWARDDLGASSSPNSQAGFGKHLSASPMSAKTSLRSLSPRDEIPSSRAGWNGGASGGNSPSGRSAPLVEEDDNDDDYVDEEDEEDLPPALPPKDSPISRRGFPPLPSPTEVRPKSAMSQRRARQKERSDFLNNVPKTAPLTGSRSGFPDRSSPSPAPSPATASIPLHTRTPSEDRPERPPSSFAVSRPSSRASRHSTRSVRRRNTKTPRRSTDAKRFPVSMAFSTTDGLDLPVEDGYEDWEFDEDDSDEEGASRTASKAKSRQHQSLDLDDVLPPHMEQHGIIPPLPPMPPSLMLKKSQDQLRPAGPDSPAPSSAASPTQPQSPELQLNGSFADMNVRQNELVRNQESGSPAQVLPEQIAHLDYILRPQPGSSALMELTILGEGESGNVYSAFCSPSAASAFIRTELVNSEIPGGQDSRVAVKVIRIPSEEDVEAASRVAGLRKELKFWEQCSLNDNVLTFFSAFYDPGSPPSSDGSPSPSVPRGIWVCQELAERSLADLIPLRTSGVEIAEPHMALIMSDMLGALEFLHSKNIVHRDCRSDIVMLTPDGKAKLSDFTHAAQLAAPGQDGRRQSQGVTITEKRTSVVGTAYWMSPEVVKAEAYDCKCDIWSLGVVLFEMIEGDPPRVDFPPLRAITLTAKLGLPPLSSPERWSRELKQFIAWATEMEPDKRPSAEMLSQTEFPFNACKRSSMVSLLAEARQAEEEEASEAEGQDTEILEEGEDFAETMGPTSMEGGALRNSWNSYHSGSTIHA